MNSIIERVMKPVRVDVDAQSGLAVSFMQVSPAVASELLKLTQRNRVINKQRVAEYAQMMSRGTWTPGQAEVCLDVEGNLINGQHTLTAVIKSGETILVTLKTGLPVDAMDSLDSHRPRKVSDQLQIDGVTNAPTVAAAGLLVMRWRDEGRLPGLTASGGASRVRGVDRLEHIAYCREHRFELEPAAALAKSRHAKTRLLPPSTICALQIVFSDYAPVHAEEWMRQLFGEQHERPDAQPVFAYRQRLVQLRGTANEWSTQFKLLFAIKSFNHFMARRPLKLFRVKPNENVNIVVPEGVN